MQPILCSAPAHMGTMENLTVQMKGSSHLQGRHLSRTGGKQDSLGDVDRPKKPVSTELAFTAEGKLLSCRFYVSDGLVHELPPSAKEVRPKESSAAVHLQQSRETCAAA